MSFQHIYQAIESNNTLFKERDVLCDFTLKSAIDMKICQYNVNSILVDSLCFQCTYQFRRIYH